MLSRPLVFGISLSDIFLWLNTYAAFPAAVIGFGLAIWQVRLALAESKGARSAAESADRAVAQTASAIRRNLQTNQIHWLIETGSRMERELAQLARIGRPEAETIVEILRAWIDSGRRVIANLGTEQTELREAIVESISRCSEARNSFSRNDFEVAVGDAWTAQEAVEAVLNMASRLSEDVIQERRRVEPAATSTTKAGDETV